MMAEKGACSDGFRTMVLPVARAGAILQVVWFIGQFHGVIMPQTPTGSLMTRVEPLVSSKA